MKIYFLKQLCNIILVGDSTLSVGERGFFLFKTLVVLGPMAYILDDLNLWFAENKIFFIGTIFCVLVNAVFGAWMHHKKKSFDWKTLLIKTLIMTTVIVVSYCVIEIVLQVANHPADDGIGPKHTIVDLFRTTIQVSTILYPVSKVLKNVFILSKREFPPQWVMEKIYGFQQNGDLKEFLNTKKDESREKE